MLCVSGRKRQSLTQESNTFYFTLFRECQIGGADLPYLIEKTGERRFAKATAIEKTYRVRFNTQWRGERLRELRRQLYDMFDEVVNQGRQGLNDNDLMRIIIRHSDLHHPIVIALQAAQLLNAEMIMQKVENVLQSEENLTLDDSFEGIFFK